LRILFVNQLPYLPQQLGGVEQTTFELVKHLARAGHVSAVMCGMNRSDAVWLRNRLVAKVSGRAFPRERYRGTLVYRGYDLSSALGEVLGDFAPEALVIAGNSAISFQFAAQAARSRLPCVYYAHDIKTLRNLHSPELLDGVALIANSRYTAGVISQCLRRDSTVLTPLIDREAYRTSGRRHCVTMVNPRRVKGGQTALELARACPDITFTFVEAWTVKEEFVTQLRKAARGLANVKWLRPTLRMREVYGATRILLAPSESEESWGRVASEAQVSGIPVIASATGGLPEAVGPGGILIEPGAPLALWVQALRSLWDDAAAYAQLSDRARVYSERPESDPQRQVEILIETLRRTALPGASQHLGTGAPPRAAHADRSTALATDR
jgi:glycosyltransferase involved in cell wall biosynthesis